MESVSGQRVGYIRVSSLDQSSNRQTEALLASGRIDRFLRTKFLDAAGQSVPLSMSALSISATVMSWSCLQSTDWRVH